MKKLAFSVTDIFSVYFLMKIFFIKFLKQIKGPAWQDHFTVWL